jgi:hypothetical protein
MTNDAVEHGSQIGNASASHRADVKSVYRASDALDLKDELALDERHRVLRIPILFGG